MRGPMVPVYVNSTPAVLGWVTRLIQQGTYEKDNQLGARNVKAPLGYYDAQATRTHI